MRNHSQCVCSYAVIVDFDGRGLNHCINLCMSCSSSEEEDAQTSCREFCHHDEHFPVKNVTLPWRIPLISATLRDDIKVCSIVARNRENIYGHPHHSSEFHQVRAIASGTRLCCVHAVAYQRIIL